MNKTNWLMLLCLLFPLGASALPQDWQQQLVIESDTAEFDRKSGIVVYRGNVELLQGTLKINADSILLIFNGNTLEQAVAEGKPAHYQQQVNPDKPVTQATAQRIEYFAGKRELKFRGQARLTQENNEFSGELIRYDVMSETVYATGSDGHNPSGDNSKKQRIKVIIQPNRADDEDIQDPQS